MKKKKKINSHQDLKVAIKKFSTVEGPKVLYNNHKIRKNLK